MNRLGDLVSLVEMLLHQTRLQRLPLLRSSRAKGSRTLRIRRPHCWSTPGRDRCGRLLNSIAPHSRPRSGRRSEARLIVRLEPETARIRRWESRKLAYARNEARSPRKVGPRATSASTVDFHANLTRGFHRKLTRVLVRSIATWLVLRCPPVFGFESFGFEQLGQAAAWPSCS